MTQPLRPLLSPPSSRELIVDDGEPMETRRHAQQAWVLIESLEYSWTERSDFYVGGNQFLYFSETQTRRNDFRGPDVFVVLNTSPHERRAWVVWEEDGKTPDVVIELLSESTESVDRGDKMRIYAKSLKVGEYFLFDPFSGLLEGYELDAARGAYRPKEADAAGRLHCRQLGLWLGKRKSVLFKVVEADWLRWMDAEGRALPMSREVAWETAERADTEAGRADAEAGRADTEAERADAEAERANAEAERADVEAERANRLAVELEALKSQLKG